MWRCHETHDKTFRPPPLDSRADERKRAYGQCSKGGESIRRSPVEKDVPLEHIMPLDLYYSAGSPPCTYVRVVAKVLGIELNLKPVNLMCKEHLTPEFLKLNPQHTVPTVDDNGFVLWESRAIATYLVNKYAPDSPLYPRDPQERAVVDRLLYFESGPVYTAQMNYFRPKWFRGQEPSEEVKAAFNKVLETAVTLLGEKKFLAGDNVTLADLGLVTSLGVSIEAVLYEDMEKYPQLVEYYNRVKTAVPEYQEVATEALDLVKRMAEKHRSGERGQCPRAGDQAQCPKSGDQAQCPRSGDRGQCPMSGEKAHCPK